MRRGDQYFLAVVLVIIILACLAACATSPKLDVSTAAPAQPPRIDPPDSALTKDCAWPLAVKLELMTKQQLEDLLRSNALNQIDCWRRHHAFVRFVRTRDDGLAGRKQE